MKKLISVISSALLAVSLAACDSFEARSACHPCWPNPDGTFSAYHHSGGHAGYSRADTWGVVCNDHFEPVVPVKS